MRAYGLAVPAVRWDAQGVSDAPDIVPLPTDEERSVYANDFAVWHSPHDVVLDLRTLGPVDATEGGRVATPVVRVRLPPTMLVDMVAALIDEHYLRQGSVDR